MKTKVLFALSVLFCLCSAYAQNPNNNEIIVSDTIETSVADNNLSSQFEQSNSMLSMVQTFAPIGGNTQPVKEQLYPLGRGLFKKHHIVQAIELCPSITKSKISKAELLADQDSKEIDDTGISLHLGYSVIFVPGREENGKLRINKAGFAYSLGFIASFTSSDRYGTTCDFLAKIGLETCHNRKMGIGFDFFGGYGKSSGDVFWYKNILEDSGATSISPYTAWGGKYGGQLWVKTGLLSNSWLSRTDVLLFARLIKAIDPGVITEASLVHTNCWKGENWSYGVILRYRM